MDEPTSSLTLSETDRLLEVIADLKASGVSVIFISHRLNEVEQCADRVVVLRDGSVVGELDASRDPPRRDDPPDDRPRPQGALHAAGRAARRRACSTSRRCARRPIRISPSAFAARGEILGLAGLVGAGRTELARAIFGIDPPRGGAIRLDGEPIVVRSPRDAIAHGIYLVPEDRKRSGLMLDVSIIPATSRCRTWRPSPSPRSSGESAEDANAEQQRRARHQGARRRRRRSSTLSGGNQQKVVLAKWLSMRPTCHDLRRADARRRRRRQERDLRPDARACRRRRRHPDDLQRHGGGDRRQRPHRGDARGRITGFLDRDRVQRGQRACSSPSATQIH